MIPFLLDQLNYTYEKKEEFPLPLITKAYRDFFSSLHFQLLFLIESQDDLLTHLKCVGVLLQGQ